MCPVPRLDGMTEDTNWKQFEARVWHFFAWTVKNMQHINHARDFYQASILEGR
jgi:hypothetical protein